jgi:hypothetical protein
MIAYARPGVSATGHGRLHPIRTERTWGRGLRRRTPPMKMACHNPPLGTESTVFAEFFDGGEGLTTCDARKPTGDV